VGIQRRATGAGSLIVTYTIDVHLSADDMREQMRADAIRGLQAAQKSIPPVWFYDERGSQLFEAITQLPEYYPTRAERALLETHASAIAEMAKADTLVELGAGACDKTRVLLDAMQQTGLLSRYVPFDVSDEFLRSAASTLSDEFDGLDMHLVIGDFHQHLGVIPTEGRRMVAFLGGTIGNLNPLQRQRFLFDLNCTMSSDDTLLLGTDLVKDRTRLVSAYDDAAGVPADFNRNVLSVLNEQLGGDFDPERFEHVALWNEEAQWIEMRLRALQGTEVSLADAGITVRFDEGEELLTEISAKFTPERVERELSEAGFVVDGMWGAEDGEFLLSLSHPFC
jgi:L-histidine N-alpha-methyltransferase